MKNFTKQITNKTLFEYTRWILMALMLLVGTSSAWGATITSDGTARLYFNMNAINWWISSSGNNNFAYFFNSSSNTWSAHAVNYSGNTYYVTIPKGSWTTVILTRNNTTTSPSWDNKWNQTGNITLSSTSNYISSFSENSTSASWGTAIKPTSAASLIASSTPVEVGDNVTLTPSLTSNQTINDIKSTTYTISPNTGATISDNTFTATEAGEYTVTATITYNPDGYSSLISTATATTTITVEDTCTPISDLTWSITSGAKATYCPGDKVTVTMSYDGTTAKGYDWGGEYDGNIDILGGSIASGAQYTMTINKSGSVYLTLTDCKGNEVTTTPTLEFTTHETPATPTVSFSVNPVSQNKPTTLTVGGYNNTLNNYTLYKEGVSQGACAASQEITISEAGEYDYHVVATSKACPSLTATSNTVTLTVPEAGARIVQLGDLTIYTNIKTDFVPMYVQNDGIMDVVGATSVKGYTWQYSSDNGASWSNCTTNYASGVVGMTNGGADCNNWRADKAGKYRCLITYDNDGTQYSNVLSVSGTTGSAPALNTFGDLPIISVNTGGKSFPDECSVSNNQYPSANADNMKKKISVDVKIYDKTGKLQYDRKARMNYRGSSSLNFKKKSYAFVTGKEKTKNADGDVDTGKANLFGLSDGAKDKDWVLYAATPDPSMMRNRLVFDLYKDMTGKWGVNSMFVELIVNNEYKGVYVLMDKITNNEKRINITSSEGFIVKFDKTDVADRIKELLDDDQEVGDEKTFKTTRTGKTGIGTYDTEVDQLFEIEYPEKDDIQQWSAFYESVRERFEKFETALANKDYATVRSLIDYDSWADWFIINEFTKNMDAYRASCLFVYNGDKIEARPLWDQELSFNNRVANIGSVGANSTSGLLIQDSGVYDDAFKAPFWFTGGGTTINGGLLNDPCFVSLVKQKWATYKEGVLSTTAVSNKVSAYANELPSTAITRENNMLPFNNNTNAGRGATSQCTGYKAIGYYGYGANTGSATDHATSKSDINTWVTNRIPALTSAIDALNGEALIFTLSPSSVETTPWQQVMITVNAPDGYEYTFDDSSINNATVKATVKKSNDTYAIKIPRPSTWGVGGNGNPDTQTQYQVSATIEVSGESECGTIQNGTATSTITLKDVTEVCDPEIVKP
ncbi:MAG: CotH kinase family protein [Paludibacteraceae bacterium]|nr:CotH kinase family protein [Paludibacteraceae bacterium]